jgi:hypothetical protein
MSLHLGQLADLTIEMLNENGWSAVSTYAEGQGDSGYARLQGAIYALGLTVAVFVGKDGLDVSIIGHQGIIASINIQGEDDIEKVRAIINGARSVSSNDRPTE